MAAGAAAVALMAAGTAVSSYGAFGQYKATKTAEKLRLRQAELEATRARREQIRRGQVARAQATARAYNQGAGESSALAGGQSQVVAQTARNVQGIGQDIELSKSLFGTNRDYAQAGAVVSIGDGITSVGKTLAANADTITRIGEGG